MILHPLFSYGALNLAFVLVVLQLLSFRYSSLARPSSLVGVFLGVVLFFSILTGNDLQNSEIISQRAPSLWLFPHKVFSYTLLVVSLVGAIYFWFKRPPGKLGVLIALLVFVLSSFILFTGWMLRLIFFS